MTSLLFKQKINLYITLYILYINVYICMYKNMPQQNITM